MLRFVSLPAGVSGELYLARMPGRTGVLDQDLAEAEQKMVSRVVCLTPRREIDAKSPAYGRALRSLPWPVDLFPIDDRGAPSDRERFGEFVCRLAGHLRFGEGILLHCGAGIGRAGLVAICVLMALGASQGQAELAVRQAGSYPETPEQRALVDWFAASKRCAGQPDTAAGAGRRQR